MKKISFLLMAFGLVATSCTKSDFDNVAYMDTVKENYNDLFTLTFGEIAPNHDWGFHADGGTNRAAMRGTDDSQWTDTHDCGWAEKLNFDLPESYTTAEKDIYSGQAILKSDNSPYYVPADFDGILNFDNYNGDLYVAANITQYYGNPGNINLYIFEGGSWERGNSTGSITVYNRGSLILGPWDLQTASNMPTIYNGGTLKIGYEDGSQYVNIADAVTINSTTDVTIYGHSEQTIDLKCALDIHGILKVPTCNLKIQNDKIQHVCGLEVAGTLDMTQGKLEASYIKADLIKFDGDRIWLLPEGHIVANTIQMPNSDTFIHGHSNSFAYIEAANFEFANKNDLTHSFSENIYFNVSGYININGCFKNSHSDGTGQNHYYIDMAEYLANTEDEYHLVAGRLNNTEGEEVTGNPGCGDEYTFYVPDDDDDPDPTPEPDPDEPTEIVYAKRIIAEDLAAGQFNADFDFNDVVFDAVVKVENGRYVGYVKVLAAGGTLPLYIGATKDEIKAGMYSNREVHGLFGEGTGTMINTGLEYGIDKKPYPTIEGIDLGPVDGGTDADALVKKINDIPVVVVSSVRGAYELTTKIGTGGEEDYKINAPMKIAVPTTYKWTKERKEISTAYPDFPEYVQTKEPQEWYNKVADTDLLYDKDKK